MVQRVASHRSSAAKSNMLPAIAAVLCSLARCQPSQQRYAVQRVASHRSSATQSNVLSAIAAALRGLAHCRPSHQRCEVQRIAVAVSQQHCKLQRVASQRRNNATSCSALSASAAAMSRAVELPAIAAALRYEEL
jgi:hypothetical protein